ncbi:hypothetical protein ACP70R_024969 [Stipagrostis hirtigluma subsp. patula]
MRLPDFTEAEAQRGFVVDVSLEIRRPLLLQAQPGDVMD